MQGASQRSPSSRGIKRLFQRSSSIDELPKLCLGLLLLSILGVVISGL